MKNRIYRRTVKRGFRSVFSTLLAVGLLAISVSMETTARSDSYETAFQISEGGRERKGLETIRAGGIAVSQAALQFHIKENFVEATFIDSREDGACFIDTIWFVSGFTDRIQDGGKPTYDPGVIIVISKNRVCFVQDPDCGDFIEFTPLVEIFNTSSVPASAVKIDPKLTSATVNATVSAYDYLNNTPITLNVSLAAVGVGDTSPEKEHSQFNGPGLKLNRRSSGIFREAQATVSVTDVNATEYTPEPPDFATLGDVKFGDLFVSHRPRGRR